MSLTAFSLTARPGAVSLMLDGVDVEGVAGVVLQAGGDALPSLTVHHVGAGTVVGDAVVTVVREPTAAEIDAAALDAISRIDAGQFAALCEAKVRAGRRDPYRVALEVLREMADG